MKKLTPNDTTALIIDLQEKIVPAMREASTLVARSRFLLAGLAVYSVPIVSTRQYPKGLGDTLPEIKELAPSATVFDKTTFSCLETPSIRAHIVQSSRPNILLAGIETHICVLQTALDLIELGKTVYLVVDCVSSRSELDHNVALQRLIGAGVIPTTSETSLFELARAAGSPEFKAISKLATGR